MAKDDSNPKKPGFKFDYQASHFLMSSPGNEDLPTKNPVSSKTPKTGFEIIADHNQQNHLTKLKHPLQESNRFQAHLEQVNRIQIKLIFHHQGFEGAEMVGVGKARLGFET